MFSRAVTPTVWLWDGDLAYVAAQNFGLRIFDISDPVMPALVGNLAVGARAWGVALQGTVAWVTSSEEGVVAVDVSNPAEPTQLGSLGTNFTALDPVISGDHLFAPDILGFLHVVDISDPSAPVLVTTLETDDLPLDLAIRDQLAYVLLSNEGLQIFDISNPAEPQLIGKYADLGLGWSIALRGTLAFVAADNDGIVVIDVAEPTRPTYVTSLDTPGEARGLAFDDNRLLVADGNSGEIRIVNITNAGNNSIVPWVVDNDAFASRVAIFNKGVLPADVHIRAVDRQGDTRTMTVEIPAESVYARAAGELFADFTGYSLFIESEADSIYPSFLTFNLEDRSGGNSPSQTTAQYQPATTSALLFGYVPGSEVAAIVLVAAAEKTGPTPVELELFGQEGGLLERVNVELTGNQPLAVLVRDLFSDVPADASVRAVATDGTLITGTTFVFNDLSQPSMAAAFPLPVVTQGKTHGHP